MPGRTYGQFCGLARALELIGERWSVLVIRDLLLSPKRFTELAQCLPRIPSSILSARLNELEQAGVVRRRVLPQLDAAVVYELTDYGSELEPILLQLGLWGARSLTEPTEGDTVTLDIAMLALHTTFRAEHAENLHVTYQLHFGDMTLHALVDDGTLKVAEGPLPNADLTISTTKLKQLMAADLTPQDAIANGDVTLDGDPELLTQFTQLFHIPPAPTPPQGLTTR
ncbi:winged helix-turn-helix transcriptional regulator [Haloechinothrix halophila]|uniref:winged helix-turn-helix transcriptional regulator n=1 Tax=Haloechinothrix halophila TaxID=1069073 RepID=UPI00054F361D|nr:winged helix-turn-helix transcriptional regulator [Haloechinothrix halophila]